MHGEYKVPGGKLVVVDLEVENGLIRNFREEIEDRIKAKRTGRMGAMAAE